MKKVLFLSFAALGSVAAMAQNTAVINQQGNTHDVSVVQRGSGNTSVVSQSSAGSSNSVVISQSGGGNVATITQGSMPDGATEPKNSVVTSQSGEGETIVKQTNDGNTISVYQTGPAPADRKKKAEKKRPRN
jgi:minor curlin subunit